jgi:preprotein translocase subunit Sss1
MVHVAVDEAIEELTNLLDSCRRFVRLFVIPPSDEVLNVLVELM